MCGIICVLSRPTRRATPTSKEILDLLDRAVNQGAESKIDALAKLVTQADELLRGDAGQFCLADNHQLVAAMTSRLDQLDAVVAGFEQTIEHSAEVQTATSELALQQIISAKDALWELRNIVTIRTAVLASRLPS